MSVSQVPRTIATIALRHALIKAFHYRDCIDAMDLDIPLGNRFLSASHLEAIKSTLMAHLEFCYLFTSNDAIGAMAMILSALIAPYVLELAYGIVLLDDFERIMLIMAVTTIQCAVSGNIEHWLHATLWAGGALIFQLVYVSRARWHLGRSDLSKVYIDASSRTLSADSGHIRVVIANTAWANNVVIELFADIDHIFQRGPVQPQRSTII